MNTCNMEKPCFFMFVTGFACTAMQTLFLREYLSVFSGNEMVIGLIYALWLLSTAAGSIAGSRITEWKRILTFLFVFSSIPGIIVLRAARLLLEPGELIPPWYIILIIILTQTDTAFFGGLVYGWLSGKVKGAKLYLSENSGAAAGLVLLTICIFSQMLNGYIIALVLLVFSASLLRKTALLYAALGIIGSFLILDSTSAAWKYPQKPFAITSGAQGEVATVKSSDGSVESVLLDGTIYRTNVSLSSVEQSVHLPLAMSGKLPQRVMVIGNQGQLDQLRKYGEIEIDCFETEKALATGGCKCANTETYKTDLTYDLVLVSGNVPSSGATSRFYTIEFFRKMHSFTGSNGVLSFTLQLSENYLSEQEKIQKDLIQTTLLHVFHYVNIIPGDGYTFVASDSKLLWPVKPFVPTDYLEAYTLASLTADRITQAESRKDTLHINSVGKPLILFAAQKQWLSMFGISFLFFGLLACILTAVAIIFVPKTSASQSVATSGFTAGVYSVALLLIYQFTYGTLYSMVAVLMIALTTGFVLGSTIRKFPFSDIIIGIYASVTLVMLVSLPYPHTVLFILFNAGIGFLAGAQFVTRVNTPWSGLYAADLTGGVLGMALSSTFLVPQFGIINVAAALGVIKLVSALIALAAKMKNTSQSAKPKKAIDIDSANPSPPKSPAGGLHENQDLISPPAGDLGGVH